MSVRSAPRSGLSLVEELVAYELLVRRYPMPDENPDQSVHDFAERRVGGDAGHLLDALGLAKTRWQHEVVT